MFDVTRFTMSDMSRCAALLRQMGREATSMEDVAGKIVRFFYDSLLIGKGGPRATSLVRFYKTHPLGDLDEAARSFAEGLLDPIKGAPDMKCFTLLGTVGDEPLWNDRRDSIGHMAIPLMSESMVERLPMLAQLLKQVGLPVRDVIVHGVTSLRHMDQVAFDLFHIEEAVGSPFLPRQEEFIKPYSIQSVIGFGGVLPPADFFAVVLFVKAKIEREVAVLFKTFPLSSKLALLPFVKGPVWSRGSRG